MRKYFLLSAVALLATSTANATTDYAEVTAKATIEVAGTFTCEDLDFGTIVVKQNNPAFTVSTGDGFEDLDHNVVLSWDGGDGAECSFDVEGATYGTIPSFKITNGTDTMDVNAYIGYNSAEGAASIDGTLSIPANVKAGDYTGSFTVTATY
ncbi:MAG: DUF4402 domain-containing protein [Alphaproteobacteria bacterium]|nr:DUF4402 domain-containing protein [Alphaproteobacteria bacterium]